MFPKLSIKFSSEFLKGLQKKSLPLFSVVFLIYKHDITGFRTICLSIQCCNEKYSANTFLNYDVWSINFLINFKYNGTTKMHLYNNC